MSETGLNPSVAPSDALEAALPGAVSVAHDRGVPLIQRQRETYQERRAATASQRAAAGLLEDEQEPGTDADEADPAAEAKALVGQWSEEEQLAVRDALMDAAVEREPAPVFGEDDDETWDSFYATNPETGEQTQLETLAQEMTEEQWAGVLDDGTEGEDE